MKKFLVLLMLGGWALLNSTASAHFLWIGKSQAENGKVTPQLCFSEEAAPGEANLVDRIASAKLWHQISGQAPVELSLNKHEEGSSASWVADVDVADGALSAYCDYGVVNRGEKNFLLQYYAKALDATPQVLEQFARCETLKLDVVPQVKGGQCTLQVLWEGKPAAGSQIVVVTPSYSEQEFAADQDGQVTIEATETGLYQIRARVQVDTPGEREGKAYPYELHYSTLAMNLPAAAEVASQPATESASRSEASQLLAHAREARALWNGFPGFKAKLRVSSADVRHEAQIMVSSEGEISINPPLEGADSVMTTLESMVAHRFGDTSTSDEVSYSDNVADHPLGRLIKLDYDTSMGSQYRIQDDVIREVHRSMGGGHFTITVLDVYRNPEGKYLPAHYTVTSWKADGSVASSSIVQDDWQRVGQWDLPKLHTSVTSGSGDSRTVSRIEFVDCQLLQ